jgi:hypothetical protein
MILGVSVKGADVTPNTPTNLWRNFLDLKEYALQNNLQGDFYQGLKYLKK